MGDDSVRARHNAAQHGDLALVHRRPAPVGNHVPIDIGDPTGLVRHQRGQQRRCSINAFELSQKLTQRGAVIAPAKQRLERMLVGIKRGEALDAKQGRKKQGLKTATQRLVAMMQQSKVVCWMCALMGLNRLLETGHYRLKGLLLVEPMGKKMHAHIRQMRRDLDQRTASGGAACRVARASLASIALPCGSQPIEMAHAHRQRSLHVGDLVEQCPGRALRIFVQ